MVSFTPRPLYLRGNSLRDPVSRKLGGPQGQSGRFGHGKSLLPLPGMEPRFVVCPARSLVIVPTALVRLSQLTTQPNQFDKEALNSIRATERNMYIRSGNSVTNSMLLLAELVMKLALTSACNVVPVLNQLNSAHSLAS